MTTTTSFEGLASLRGLRTAPQLEPGQKQLLRQELSPLLAACEWFTVGVMAPSAVQALAALRRLEAAMGWPALREARDGGGEVCDGGDGAPEAAAAPEGPVFLKGHQRNGTYRLRAEAGLGEGLLITGHHDGDPACEGTWGPLPLDLFD